MDLLVQLPENRKPAHIHAGLLSYMMERHLIWKRRFEQGRPFPWTTDAILQKYKFTNVYRDLDRTTQDLLPMYQTHATNPLTVRLMNAAVFRYFGFADMAWAIGWQAKHTPVQKGAEVTWLVEPALDIPRIKRIVAKRKSLGLKVFTGAYVVTNAGRAEPKETVVCDYLQGLFRNLANVVQVMENTNSWQHATEALSVLEGFGGSGFMAKETLLDVMLSGWKPKDAATWTPVGPGARRGLNRIHLRPLTKNIKAEQMQEEIRTLRGLIMQDWPAGWQPLTAHDIQFSLCEYDKYCRAALGEGKPRSTYQQERK